MPEQLNRELRYSERKRLAETGSLGDYNYDEIPPEVRNAVVHLVRRASGHSTVGDAFAARLRNECVEHFGWHGGMTAGEFAAQAPTDDFLDFVEMTCATATAELPYTTFESDLTGGSYRRHTAVAFLAMEAKLNGVFDRHRFGYRLSEGNVHRISSPALDQVAVGPALLAVQRPGWQEVERSYREALDHQRAGADERDDALTAANAALEAALKAVGMKGGTLGDLAREFKRAEWVPPQLRGVPEALDTLLKREGALRNIHGDAHGKAPGADQVPQALANLAIHWAGAFISFLAEIAPEPGQQSAEG